MKRGLIFLITLIILFGLANPVLALLLPNPLSAYTFQELITKIVNYIATVVGGLAVIVFIWAGILFLTSGGNETQLSKAKKALFYAAIGLAIALAASGLIYTVRFIIGG